MPDPITPVSTGLPLLRPHLIWVKCLHRQRILLARGSHWIADLLASVLTGI